MPDNPEEQSPPPPSSGRTRLSRSERFADHLSFDAPQRRILILLLSLLLAYGLIGLIRNRAYIADPQPPVGDRAAELLNRLDPNTATAAELTAVPGLGAVRAANIVAYREKILARDPAAVPFRSADDLFYVDRFGRPTVEQSTPYLVFPATQNTHDKIRTVP